VRDEAPLQAGREAGAAPTAQPRVLDKVHELGRLHLERLLQAGVAAARLVDVDVVGARNTHVPRQDLLVALRGWLLDRPLSHWCPRGRGARRPLREAAPSAPRAARRPSRCSGSRRTPRCSAAALAPCRTTPGTRTRGW